MRFQLTAAAALLVLPVALAAAAAPAAPAPTLLHHCGHLIDPAAGRMLGASTVVIERDRDAADMALMKQHGTWYVPTLP